MWIPCHRVGSKKRKKQPKVLLEGSAALWVQITEVPALAPGLPGCCRCLRLQDDAPSTEVQPPIVHRDRHGDASWCSLPLFTDTGMVSMLRGPFFSVLLMEVYNCLYGGLRALRVPGITEFRVLPLATADQHWADGKVILVLLFSLLLTLPQWPG